jgi:putative oxidoreductase
MKNYTIYAQLFLRLALGIGFIYPVLDRTGFLGIAGEANISWGNWANFVSYTGVLLPFLPLPLREFSAIVASIAEAVLGILLIIGFQLRWTAMGSCILLALFALCMTLFTGIKSAFNYSVFSACAGALLLSALPGYRYSIDYYNIPRDKKNLW